MTSHIHKQLEGLPAHLQVEVLHFIEFLAQKNRTAITSEHPAQSPEQSIFHFIGRGDSQGEINQIENLRDFAHDA